MYILWYARMIYIHTFMYAVCICIFICMYTVTRTRTRSHTHTRTRTHTHWHAYWHTRTHAHTYAHTHTHTHTYTHTHTHTWTIMAHSWLLLFFLLSNIVTWQTFASFISIFYTAGTRQVIHFFATKWLTILDTPVCFQFTQTLAPHFVWMNTNQNNWDWFCTDNLLILYLQSKNTKTPRKWQRK